jgi:hypothetical protein
MLMKQRSGVLFVRTPLLAYTGLINQLARHLLCF